MTIRFHPEGLNRVVGTSWEKKRLKNKFGEVNCETCTTQLFSGELLEVLKRARLHDSDFSDHSIIVTEDSCGSLVS